MADNQGYLSKWDIDSRETLPNWARASNPNATVLGVNLPDDIYGQVHPAAPNLIQINKSLINNERAMGNDVPDTVMHEFEHTMWNQKNYPNSFGTIWDQNLESMGRGQPFRDDLSDRWMKASPYLKEKYNFVPDAYFDKKSSSGTKHLLAEQMASLSALEERTGKRLIDDPYIRQNVLNTPELRATYTSMTGPRLARLDAKDLQPATPFLAERPSQPPQQASQSSFLDKLQQYASRYLQRR